MSDQPARKSVLVVSPYSAVTPRYGGPIRVLNLRSQLAKRYDVIGFAQFPERREMRLASRPSLAQISPSHVEVASRNVLSMGLYSVTNLWWQSPPIWQSAVLSVTKPSYVTAAFRQAFAVQVEHPWQFGWVDRQVGADKPLILSAHNVESDLYTADSLRLSGRAAGEVARRIRSREARALRRADVVLAVTEDDAEVFSRSFGMPASRCHVIPNGVDTAWFSPANADVRRAAKKDLGIGDRPVVIFSGSFHPPNVEAVRHLVRWAGLPEFRDIVFLVVGTVGNALVGVEQANLIVTRRVSDVRPYFSAADVALNPMSYGGGSNLKQLEYMAMGLPTVATPVGLRGIGATDGLDCYESPLDDLPARLKEVLGAEGDLGLVGERARKYAVTQFDWDVIGRRLLEIYRTLE